MFNNKIKKVFLLDEITLRAENTKKLLRDKYNNFIELYEEIDSSKLKTSKLNNKSVALLHSSFSNYEKLVDYLHQRINIPIVHFSGNNTDKIISESEISINSQTLYENIIDFLDYLISSKKIELKILIYGKNYKLLEVFNLREKIILEIFNTKNNDQIILSNKLRALVNKFLEISGLESANIVDFIKNLESYNKVEFKSRIDTIYKKIN